MDRISRRRFLEDSVTALAAASLPGAALAASSRARSSRRTRVSPNDKVNVAVIGVNGRGKDHLKGWAALPDVNIVAICDADTGVFARALAVLDKTGRPTPRTVQDIRTLLADKEVDAVSIATPNHWHALAAIWAMQHGKDVYVEKPVSHQVAEGRRIVEVARKTQRICQAGTQSRSSRGLQEAMAFLHRGELGHVHLARGLCYKRRDSIGKVIGAQQPPATCDYDLWTGPAPMKPVMREHFHYDWHWLWDYGNGDVGNQGIHEMDKARWGLNQSGLPVRTLALGGRFGYVDDGETPNTLLVFHDYVDCHLIFEVRGLKTDSLHGEDRGDSADPKAGVMVGNIFYGDKGVMVVPDYSRAVVYDNDGNKVHEFAGGGDHFANFIEAVRSRRVEDLHADIEEGHISSAMCHLGNISYQLGAPAPFEPRTKAFGDDKEAYETFGRYEAHLAANGVTLSSDTYRLGKALHIDPERENFVGNREANGMLTREYRKGFVVPARA